MDASAREIAKIIDKNIHKKRINIHSKYLNSDQEFFIREFIYSVKQKEKFLR